MVKVPEGKVGLAREVWGRSRVERLDWRFAVWEGRQREARCRTREARALPRRFHAGGGSLRGETAE